MNRIFLILCLMLLSINNLNADKNGVEFSILQHVEKMNEQDYSLKPNFGTYLSQNKVDTHWMTFFSGVEYMITVVADTGVENIDLSVHDNMNIEVLKDEDMSNEVVLTFTPEKTAMYSLLVSIDQNGFYSLNIGFK